MPPPTRSKRRYVLAPDEAEAHINLGLVYLRLERPDDAKRELEIGEVLAVKQERR